MIMDQFRLDGRLAVVYGGSGGIGRSAVKVFLEQGARVIITGRSQQHIDETLATLPADAAITVVQGDVTSPDHIQAIVDTAASLGGADILVNSVGAQRRKPLTEATVEDLNYLMSVNMMSVFDLTQRLVPQMQAKQYGKIINMCSITSFVARAGKTLYAITKGALWMYTKGAAVDLAPCGIRVNGIAPGLVDTPMTHDYIEANRDEFLKVIPLRRFATTQDLEPVFAYLASAASDDITGQIMVVDGGETTQ